MSFDGTDLKKKKPTNLFYLNLIVSRVVRLIFCNVRRPLSHSQSQDSPTSSSSHKNSRCLCVTLSLKIYALYNTVIYCLHQSVHTEFLNHSSLKKKTVTYFQNNFSDLRQINMKAVLQNLLTQSVNN